ncbi:MAG: helix-turn-helix domain-containing protein [Vicinamibacterales bacterium]
MAKGQAPRIVDPLTHPQREVNLTVAAAFLGLNPRTVRARVDEGAIKGWRDGKVYRVDVADLRAYRERRDEVPT